MIAVLSLATILSTLQLTLGATHPVAVGAANGSLEFFPSTVTAAAGDTVEFMFGGGDHSASQSTFDKPCALSGGFDSGLEGDKMVNYTVTVNDTNPIWVFCKQAGHCQAGMVMAINAPTSGDNTFANFQAKAEGKSIASSSASASGSSASASGTSAAATSSMASMSSMSASATSGSASASATSGAALLTKEPIKWCGAAAAVFAIFLGA